MYLFFQSCRRVKALIERDKVEELKKAGATAEGLEKAERAYTTG